MTAKNNNIREEDLRRIQFSVEHAPDAVYWVGRNGELAYVNEAACRTLGYTKEEFSTMTVFDIDPLFPREKWDDHWRKTREHGSHVIETAHRSKDGRTIPVEIAIAFMAFGEKEYHCAYARDITERRKAEQAMRSSEEKFSKAFRVSPDSININRLSDGQYIEVNQGFTALTGYTPEEVIGKTSLEINIWADYADRQRLIDGLRTLGEVNNLEAMFRLKNGGIRSGLMSARIINLHGEQCILSITRDITERKQTEELLRANDARVRAIIDGAPFGAHSYELHADGRLIFSGSNKSADRILGTDHSLLVGKTIEEAFPPLAGTSIPESYRRVASTGRNFETDQVNYEDSQVRGAFEIHAFQTAPNRMTVFFRDITERKRAEEALKQSEERLAFALSAANEGIWDYNPAKERLYWSPRYYTMLGYAPGEITPSTTEWRSLLHPDDLHQAVQGLDNCLKGRSEEYNQECRFRTKSGSYQWILVRGRVVERDETGAVVRMAGTHSDISERKRTEAALQFSEQKFRRIVQTVPGIIFILDLNGKFLMSEGKALAQLGLVPGQVVGISALDMYNDHPSITQSIRQALDGTLTRSRNELAGGTFDTVYAPYYDVEGKQIGVLGLAIDISEQKKAEESLRESEERFRTTLYSIGDGVITTDITGAVLQMNHVAESLTGWKEAEAQGKPIQEVFNISNEESGEAVTSPVDQVLADGGIVGLANHTELVARDGTRRPISDSGAPIKNARGETTGVVLVFNDQSERRELQAKLLQAQKMEAVGRLAGGVAHDFNNMIGVILGYANLVENRLDPLDPLQKNVHAIMSAAERSANLTKQLLAFARKQIVTPVPLNLNRSLSMLQRMLTRLIGEDLSLNILPGENLWNIKIDPTQVDQILTNLSTNARDAIDNVGTITIQTSNIVIGGSSGNEHHDVDPGEYVLLVFSDTGKGMDKATQNRIFEPFFTTKPKGQGTGLGLATVFGIVKQNNGSINVHSEPGKGTTFRLFFPRFHGEVATVLETKQQANELKGSETVLVVEDEEQLLDLARTALEMFGYTILTATSPGDALALFEKSEEQIDLLLTDVVMPGMNGRELRDRLVAMKPGLKSMFMSGYTADVVAQRGILEEGVDFLQKPFTPLTLATKVRAVLDERKKDLS